MRRLVTIVVLSSIACFGCDSGERTFTAEEFVEAINEKGAFVSLGPLLTTSTDGVDVRSVTLTELADTPTSPGEAPKDGHGSGGVLVMESAEEAEAELQRCEGALSLVCFRAANVVLRFEGLFPEEEERITAALQAIATE